MTSLSLSPKGVNNMKISLYHELNAYCKISTQAEIWDLGDSLSLFVTPRDAFSHPPWQIFITIATKYWHLPGKIYWFMIFKESNVQPTLKYNIRQNNKEIFRMTRARTTCCFHFKQIHNNSNHDDIAILINCNHKFPSEYAIH